MGTWHHYHHSGKFHRRHHHDGGDELTSPGGSENGSAGKVSVDDGDAGWRSWSASLIGTFLLLLGGNKARMVEIQVGRRGIEKVEARAGERGAAFLRGRNEISITNEVVHWISVAHT